MACHEIGHAYAAMSAGVGGRLFAQFNSWQEHHNPHLIERQKQQLALEQARCAYHAQNTHAATNQAANATNRAKHKSRMAKHQVGRTEASPPESGEVKRPRQTAQRRPPARAPSQPEGPVVP